MGRMIWPFSAWGSILTSGVRWSTEAGELWQRLRRQYALVHRPDSLKAHCVKSQLAI